MKKHISADELIRGTGFKNGRGCAVGCTLDSYDHSRYPIELGIPLWIAFLEDRLFENMSEEKSKTFPLLFLKSIPTGVDLDQVKAPFLIFVLESTLAHFDHEKFPDCKEEIDRVIDLYKSCETDLEKFKAAAWRTASDADDAYDADAAYDAYDADAAYAAYNAASYAARAASYSDAAAYAASYSDAAYAASYYAYAAYAPYNAAVGVIQYDKFADKLIELIKDLKT
jgi:hypothetical protein